MVLLLNESSLKAKNITGKFDEEESHMSLYSEYLAEIEVRKADLGLNPKPIDSAELLSEIIAQIKDTGNADNQLTGRRR